MTYVDASDSNELRIILCLEFEPHAEPAEVAALKSSVIDSENTVRSVEVTGDFDFMAEIKAPDLGWFNRWWKSLGRLVAAATRRSEKSFVCRQFIRRPKDDRALWVRCGDDLKRLEHSLIDKIVAEGDYARVFSQGQSWLLHATMHSLHARLSSRKFIQLHRSIIVRCAFIDGLVHEQRHWIARLRDGTSERISRSHLNETLKATHSPTPGNHSSIQELVVER